MSDPAEMPRAEIMRPRRFQLIWLVPVVAALIAAYLAVDAIRSRGPTITIEFSSAEGLQAGQTKIRHKAVELGVVESVDLTPDQSRVIVRVKMRREATPQLTEAARFWVVRPRLQLGNVSGLETLISGAYIELDSGSVSGAPAGEAKRSYVGLERPPAVRSDEPGQTFVLRAPRIGGVSIGSPVLYRDLAVGEVLESSLDPDGSGFTVQIFVRRPYDDLVHDATYFWNSSGIGIDLGANGVRVKLDSLQALLGGAITFTTTAEGRQTAKSAPGARFRLFPDEATAAAAGYKRRLPFLTHFTGSVRGLAVGAPVEVQGIQVGNVTDVRLVFDPAGRESHVDIRYEIQPGRILSQADIDRQQPLEVTQTMVRRGLRMQLHTANYLTGQLVVSLDFVEGAPPAEARMMENGDILVPSQAGGIDNLLTSVTEVTQQLARIPFGQIGQDLAAISGGLARITGGDELRRSVTALAASLVGVQELVRKTDAGLGPALRRMPEIAAQVSEVLDRGSRLLNSADASYGSQSDVKRDLGRLLAQFSDAARSVRLLADFLTQHPEALIQGRTGRGTER